MTWMLQALLMAALSGPGDAEAPAARSGFTPFGDPIEDLRRRAGDRAVDESDGDEEKAQEDGRKDRPDLTRPELAPSSSGALDFEWLELEPRAGVAIFSKDYHVNPSPAVGVRARVPMTFLSPSSNPDGEYFGLFAQLDVSFITRTIEPKLDKASGPIFMGTLGMDFTFYRSENWLLLLEGGIQYCYYGGITDLHNGYAPMAGLKVGISISRSVNLTFCPEYIMGEKGDAIMIAWVGALIEF